MEVVPGIVLISLILEFLVEDQGPDNFQIVIFDAKVAMIELQSHSESNCYRGPVCFCRGDGSDRTCPPLVNMMGRGIDNRCYSTFISLIEKAICLNAMEGRGARDLC